MSAITPEIAEEISAESKAEDSDRDTVAPSRPGFGFPNPSTGEPRTVPVTDEQPKRRGRPPGSKNRPKEETAYKARPRNTKLGEQLQSTITFIGIGVSTVNRYDGAVILKGAENLAKSLDKLAQENESVRKVLESALTASAWGAVVASGAAIAIPIMANHDMAPAHLAPLFGCPPPDIEGEGERVE